MIELKIILSCVGMMLSLYMWRMSSGGRGLPGCGGGSGCDEVIRSRWSQWFSVPVSAPASMVYAMLALLLMLSHPRVSILSGNWPMILKLGAGFVLGGAAIWFTWLQLGVIRQVCAYCLVLHVLGLSIGGLLIVQFGDGLKTHTVLVGVVAVAVLGLIALVAGQVLMAPKLYAVEAAPLAPASPRPAVNSDGTQRDERRVSVLNGAVTLDVNSWPCLGSPEARHVVACLFDYTCPTCRQTHGFLFEAVERYAGLLAVVLLPVPMDPTCNRHLSKQHHLHAHACKFARLALLVWQANPAAYEKFDKWVFQDAEPPLIGVAIQKVKELLKTDDVDPARPDRDVDTLIFQAIDWYKQFKTERIPTLLFSNASLKGQLPSTAELCRILEQEYPELRVQRAIA